MTSTDEPFELPDMTDVLEMAGVIDTLDENAMTAAAVEDEIIKYVDRIGNEVARLIHPESSVVGDDAVVLPTRNRLIHPESLALGDAAVVRTTWKWLQTSLVPLFAAGELLPPDQRLRYLIRLRLVILAAYNIGGFTRITRTVQQSVRKKTHAGIQGKGTKAAQAKRAPEKRKRQELVRQVHSAARIKTAANVRRELQKQGLHRPPATKTIRSDLQELGLYVQRTPRRKQRS